MLVSWQLIHAVLARFSIRFSVWNVGVSAVPKTSSTVLSLLTLSSFHLFQNLLGPPSHYNQKINNHYEHVYLFTRRGMKSTPNENSLNMLSICPPLYSRTAVDMYGNTVPSGVSNLLSEVQVVSFPTPTFSITSLQTNFSQIVIVSSTHMLRTINKVSQRDKHLSYHVS